VCGIGVELDLQIFIALSDQIIGNGVGEAEHPVGSGHTGSADETIAEIGVRDAAAREVPKEWGTRRDIAGMHHRGQHQAFVDDSHGWHDHEGRLRRNRLRCVEGVIDDDGRCVANLSGEGGIAEKLDQKGFWTLGEEVAGDRVGEGELAVGIHGARTVENARLEICCRDSGTRKLPVEPGAGAHVGGLHRGDQFQTFIDVGHRRSDRERGDGREGGVFNDVGRRGTHLHGAGGIGEELDLNRFGALGGLVVGEGVVEAEEPVGGNRS